MSKSELTNVNEKSLEAVPEAATPATLLAMAVQQGADMDKLERLMDMQERWEANEARKAYVKAMSKFRAQCPAIEKTKKAHNSNFAGLAETIEEIKELLSKCQLSHSWRTDQKDTLISVTCCVTHAQGHSECTTLSAGSDTSGSKNAIQGIGSTISYLERYTLYAILGLASKEMDTDGGAPTERLSEEQQENILALITEVGADKHKFYKHFKINDLSTVAAVNYKVLVDALEAKRKAV